MYVEEKSIEKENVCFEEARRESIKENERKAVDMSQDVCLRSRRNRKQEAERASQNQECQDNKCSGAEVRTKDACSPQKQLLSSCPPHQLTQLQQTSPMLSSTTCQLKP